MDQVEKDRITARVEAAGISRQALVQALAVWSTAASMYPQGIDLTTAEGETQMRAAIDTVRSWDADSLDLPIDEYVRIWEAAEVSGMVWVDRP